MKKPMILLVIILAANCFLPKEASAYCVNHAWVEDFSMYQAPTCVREGYRWYDCISCYESKKEGIPPTGIHNWSEWKADGELCKDGKWSRYCKDCYIDETKTRYGDGSHMWSEWEVYKNADCLNDGKKSRYCYKCYEYEYKVIPASKKKHNWSNWSWLYSKNGGTGRKCYTCSKIQNVRLNTHKKTMSINKSFVLRAKKKGYGDKVVKFTSSNKKVATVNRKGKVVARKRGKATITVKMKSGCRAKCKITVR